MTPCHVCTLDPLLPVTAQSCSPSRRRKNHRRRLDYRQALHYLLRQPANPRHLREIHAHILRRDLTAGEHADQFLISRLFLIYSSTAPLSLASRLFALFPIPPTFVFNLMIRAHIDAGEPRRGLVLYNRMVLSGVPLDKFTFPFAVRSCAACADAAKGMEVHALAIKSGFSRDPYLLHALISLYFTCGNAADGRKVFDSMRVRTVVTWTALVSGLIASGDLTAARAAFDDMPDRNVVSWTAMIDGCTRNGRPEEAFALFSRMLEENLEPNAHTMVSLLMACAELGSLSLGRWVHDFAGRNGLLKGGFYVGTALIDMYSKCGSIADALKVFDEMPVRSVPTWNSMITSLGMHGRGKEALELFGEMQKANAIPDAITFVGVLCACARSGMVEEGLRLYKLMKDCHNIESVVKHDECLAELLGSVSILGKADDIVNPKSIG